MSAPANTPAVGAPEQAAPALAPRPARSLSPSRANDFVTCPMLYRFRAIDRLPEPPSAAASRGTLVHAVLEDLFGLPSDQRNLEAAAVLLPQCWQRMRATQPQLDELVDSDDEVALQRWFTAARGLLAKYFQLEDPTALNPAAREFALSVELPSGLTLRGIVDRIDRAPDGALRVVDYKTGRSPSRAREAAAMFQLRFYALAMWHQLERLPRVLQLMYLADGVVLELLPERSDLRAITIRVEALWSAIERATETGDWRANPGRACDWCAHRGVCPAWGGTPPEPPAHTIDLR